MIRAIEKNKAESWHRGCQGNLGRLHWSSDIWIKTWRWPGNKSWASGRKAFQAEKVACAEKGVQPVCLKNSKKALTTENRKTGDSRMGDEVREKNMGRWGVCPRMSISTLLPSLRKSCKNKVPGKWSSVLVTYLTYILTQVHVPYFSSGVVGH